MKAKYLIILLVIIIVSFFLFNKQRLENVYSKLGKTFGEVEEKGNLTTTETTFQPLGEENKTVEENYSEVTPSESQFESISKQQKSEAPPKALTLEIIDICSGKLENVFAVSEGVRQCLNQRYPYYILLEKNLTHLKASFYNITGFNETYELNESNLIFFVFAEDIASVSKIIQSFYIEGNPEFYLGDYDLHTIWERDESSNLSISKMIVALPLYVKNTVSSGWSELKFYLNIPNKTYYLGNLWVLVKEK